MNGFAKGLRVQKKGTFLLFSFLVFSLCILNALEGYATLQNNYSFKQISYEQGLPGINLRDQIQDKNGIMWICVESIGLCKYDGHKFTLYNNEPDKPTSISSNDVNKIAEDEKGNLWIASDYGLNYFDVNKQTFKVFLNNPNDSLSIPNNICKFVLVDTKGNLWVGTENGIAFKEKNSDTFKRFLSISSSIRLQQLSILNISEQANGIFWLGTNDGLIKFDTKNGAFKKWRNNGITNNAPIHNRISDILPDKKGYLWIATHRGLDRFNLQTEKFDHWKYKNKDINDLELEGVNTLLIDKFEKLWVGTDTKGIVVIDPETNEYDRISKENSGNSNIKSNYIRYLFEDNLGLIWVGTKFEGIFKYNDNINVFNNWPKNQEALLPLKNTSILSFFEDQNGYYWLGSKMEGLFKVNSKSGEIINYIHQSGNKSSICSNQIQYILRDSRQKLWIGTESGLNLMDEVGDSFLKISETSVNCICEDHNRLIWVGTPTGIVVVDQFKNIVKQFNSNHSFFRSNNYEIMQIYCDSEGTIWYTTRYNGLFSYSHQNNSFIHLQYNVDTNTGIGGNMTRSILEDSKNRFWIGTKSQGLSCLNRSKQEYVRYTIEDGLPSNMILSLEEDLNGNIWMGTHNGIAKFNPENKTVCAYNSNYGLKSNISEIGASHTFKTGELLLGGDNGFNIFNPEEIKQNDYIASLFISSIKIDDIEIDKTAIVSNEINLNYKQKRISFEFSLSDYNAPFRHQYAVMMEGVDKEYRQLANRNFISYSNLASGKYILKLKGANEFGVWIKEPVLLNITVKKPIYKLFWFRALSSIILLVIIAIVIFQMRKRQNTLERLMKERTKKLEIAYKELLNKNTKIREQNRQIELQQANLEQKVIERTRDLEIAKSKAEESDRLKSSFLANMSHEIRTPLNAITGFSALVGGNLYNPERKQKYVDIIKTNTVSLLKLVDDILDISRIEAKQLSIEKELFDFNTMISELNLIFQKEIRLKRDKTVKLYFEDNNHLDSSFMFFSDQIRIRQVLVNLLNNAIKFTSIGDIRFGYKLEENNIIFWVKDTGIGIKKEDIDSIFNRFMKIENENVMYQGTGLGLSISRSLVDMLGGKIWVKSLENIGSSFYFNIPGEIKMQNNHFENIKTQLPINIDLKDKSILVVEFDRSNYILIHSYLIGTNANIIWANNNNSAIEYWKKDKFDLVILDFRIQDKESNLTFNKLKEIHPKLPILAQTSYATDEDKIELASIGFNDYIIKPFLKKELLEKIKQLI